MAMVSMNAIAAVLSVSLKRATVEDGASLVSFVTKLTICNLQYLVETVHEIL